MDTFLGVWLGTQKSWPFILIKEIKYVKFQLIYLVLWFLYSCIPLGLVFVPEGPGRNNTVSVLQTYGSWFLL